MRPKSRKPFVFIASPSDVGAERSAAIAVAKSLCETLPIDVRVEHYEDLPLTAGESYQPQIPSPADPMCIATICILGEKFGSPITAFPGVPPGQVPADLMAYCAARSIDVSIDPSRHEHGSVLPISGTLFEFLEACRGPGPVLLLVKGDRNLIYNAAADPMDRGFGLGQHLSQVTALPGTATANVSVRLLEYSRQVRWLARFYDGLIFKKGAPQPHEIIRSASDLEHEARRWLKKILRYATATPDQMFKSAEPYGVGDWPGLFGRGREVRSLVGRMDAAHAAAPVSGRRPFAVVHGRSGAGKTSFVRAGVAGSLQAQGDLAGRRFVPVFIERDDLGLDQVPPRPDGQAIPRLALALARELSLPEFTDEAERYPPADAQALVGMLSRHVAQHRDAKGCQIIPVVVFDQFEDALRLRQIPAHHRAFDDNIATALEVLDLLTHQRLGWSIICLPNEPAIDEDDDAELESDQAKSARSSLASWRNLDVVRRAVERHGAIDEFPISATSDIFLDEIIRQPFLHLGPGLEERAYRLVRDQLQPITDGDHVPLPLVSVHLAAIYQRWRTRQTSVRPIRNTIPEVASDVAAGLESETYGAVTADDVEGLSLAHSIARLGEESLTVFARQTGTSDIQRSIERLFRQLVDVPERRRLKRRVSLFRLKDIGIGSRLPGGITRTEARLAEALVAARLLVRSGPQKVRLAHKCILEYWPRARDWLARDTALLETRDDIGHELRLRAGRPDPGMMPAELVDRIHQLLIATADTGFLDLEEQEGIVAALEQQFARLPADRTHSAYLHAALRARNQRLLQWYLKGENLARLDLDAVDGSDLKKPVLLVAAEEQLFDVVHRLLEAGASPRHSSDDGRTVLHGLAGCGDGEGAVAAINAVIERLGRDRDARQTVINRPIRPANWTCLHLAAAQGSHAVVKALLAGGADRLLPSRSGQLALHFALRHRDAGLVETLLSEHKRRQIEHNMRDGKTALLLAAEMSSGAVIDVLLTGRATIAKADASGSTPIHLAAAIGNTSTLKALLAHGKASAPKLVNRMNERGATALMLACRRGHAEAVALLLEHGADPRVRAVDGETAMLHACRQPDVAIVEALLATSKIRIDHTNAIGMSALHVASHYGFADIVDCLLRANAKHDLRTDMQRTPLHLAAREGHRAVVERLLATGDIDVGAQTVQGQTAAHLAAYYGHADVLQRLLADLPETDLDMQDLEISPLRPAPAPPAREDTADEAAVSTDSEASPPGRRGSPTTVVEEAMQEDLGRGTVLSRIKGRRTALYSAAQAGHIACVQSLLRRGANPRITDARGITPLLAAAFAGNTEIARELMGSLAGDLASLRQCDMNLRTLLHAAAFSGDYELFENALAADAGAIDHEDIFGQTPLVAVAFGLAERSARNDAIDDSGPCRIFERLVGLGARINVVSDDGRTSLHYAALSGSEAFFSVVWKAVAALSGVGANAPSSALIAQPDKRGCTALHLAATRGAVAIVERLLDHGADVSGTDAHGFTALHRAAYSGRSDAAVAILHHAAGKSQALVQHLLTVRSSKFGKSALHCAAEGDAADLVNILGSHGVSMEQRTWLEASTALHLAALNDRAKAVRALISAGAERNVRDALGGTPLGGAAKEGNLEALAVLLDGGADPNAPGYLGQPVVPSMARQLPGHSALATAAAHGQVEAARQLIAHRVDIRHRGPNGSTSLHQAAGAREHSPEMIALLLEHGADPGAADDRGFTPIHIAAMRGAPETVADLLDRGQYMRGPQRTTLAHSAARGARVDVLQLLKARKQKLTAPDAAGRIPLHYAASSNRPDAVATIEWLLRHNSPAAARDKDKNTAAHIAAAQGRGDIVISILKRHPQVAALVNDRGHTPLHVLALRADAETIAALAGAGVSMSGKRVPIHMLVARAAAHALLARKRKLDADLPQWLQEVPEATRESLRTDKWQDVLEAALGFKDIQNELDGLGRTPLHLACELGEPKTVGLLLKSAPLRLIKVKDKREHTPVSLAMLGSHTAVINLLQESVEAQQAQPPEQNRGDTKKKKPADVLRNAREAEPKSVPPLSALLGANERDRGPTFH